MLKQKWLLCILLLTSIANAKKDLSLPDILKLKSTSSLQFEDQSRNYVNGVSIKLDSDRKKDVLKIRRIERIGLDFKLKSVGELTNEGELSELYANIINQEGRLSQVREKFLLLKLYLKISEQQSLFEKQKELVKVLQDSAKVLKKLSSQNQETYSSYLKTLNSLKFEIHLEQNLNSDLVSLKGHLKSLLSINGELRLVTLDDQKLDQMNQHLKTSVFVINTENEIQKKEIRAQLLQLDLQKSIRRQIFKSAGFEVSKEEDGVRKYSLNLEIDLPLGKSQTGSDYREKLNALRKKRELEQKTKFQTQGIQAEKNKILLMVEGFLKLRSSDYYKENKKILAYYQKRKSIAPSLALEAKLNLVRYQILLVQEKFKILNMYTDFMNKVSPDHESLINNFRFL